ncbi:MAG: prephenate dehydrogenase [Chloroflexi bacterium ADurb.Bin325]|nr:MAG: prephenate dehydrogenase [Chloroflexi bacterium ADurb.Bin325]
MRFEQISSTPDVCIVGLGLMGGSLALALKEAGWRGRVTAVSRNPRTLAAAESGRAIDRGFTDLAAGVADAGMIVLATPVRTLLRQLPEVGRHARDGAVVLDMGSTKAEICAALADLPQGLEPVGGHPMCGKESAGFEAADANLYRGKMFVLCPLARTTAAALRSAHALVDAVGAHPLVLDPAAHDRAVAAISHLPYALAVALVNAVAAADDPLAWTLAASGFRDTSRVAASDVDMMLDVLLSNRQNVMDWLQAYARQLASLYAALSEQDEAALRRQLAAAQERRAPLNAG